MTVLKSGSLNLLEPSGPVQVCNGIALPLHVVVAGKLLFDVSLCECLINAIQYAGTHEDKKQGTAV